MGENEEELDVEFHTIENSDIANPNDLTLKYSTNQFRDRCVSY